MRRRRQQGRTTAGKQANDHVVELSSGDQSQHLIGSGDTSGGGLVDAGGSRGIQPHGFERSFGTGRYIDDTDDTTEPVGQTRFQTGRHGRPSLAAADNDDPVSGGHGIGEPVGARGSPLHKIIGPHGGDRGIPNHASLRSQQIGWHSEILSDTRRLNGTTASATDVHVRRFWRTFPVARRHWCRLDSPLIRAKLTFEPRNRSLRPRCPYGLAFSLIYWQTGWFVRPFQGAARQWVQRQPAPKMGLKYWSNV